MRVLVACEESQTVCKAFRERGFEAYSCDLQECSGGHPEWHIKDDIKNVVTDNWDLMIAHPPCTHLATSGAKHFEQKRKDGRQKSAIDFFMFFTNTKIPHVAIENPMGIMNTVYRKPDQIFHPYHFGDPAQKTTCLWLFNLPKLTATHYDAPLFGESVNKGEFYEFTTKKGIKKRQPMWFVKGFFNAANTDERMKNRSFRFPGFAKAIAEQWGDYLLTKYKKSA